MTPGPRQTAESIFDRAGVWELVFTRQQQERWILERLRESQVDAFLPAERIGRWVSWKDGDRIRQRLRVTERLMFPSYVWFRAGVGDEQRAETRSVVACTNRIEHFLPIPERWYEDTLTKLRSIERMMADGVVAPDSRLRLVLGRVYRVKSPHAFQNYEGEARNVDGRMVIMLEILGGKFATQIAPGWLEAV